ncbi:hypothetical protein GCM10010912_52010 [Paenibacillus albidus]|uniref:Biotin/lipoyl-binding protein n=1 Tax=Paenibacillus albidus TaxID=2041023 RepID=A0A917CVU3_9BACL|nr:hypothetical protein GCM10010912_52010 [Paenibacillus albidus]
MEWEGFLSLVETGAQVKAGQLLLEFDMEFIEAADDYELLWGA